MKRGLLLVTLFLILKLRSSHSRCEETGSLRPSSDTMRLEGLKRNIMRRYTDLDYDSFVGLMGKRNAEEEDVESSQKREMDDIFVGLMGRRNADSDNSPWRREYPERRVFLNKSRLRLLQGL
ncbi:tachykinin-3a isoform X2 [Girardinichthys multiradiatus]|uniref:tachykinin-3a isoform X2 n=1 Tax=Girardinichthys multiradiatus TaxID=208333 RepID=UPI001FAC9A5F|nr:tachykinin-3a isoform X2 [Girardinichthys multiradiatus]